MVDGSSGVGGKGVAAVKRVAHRVVDGRALGHAVDAGAVLVRYELLKHVVERRLAVGLDVVGGGALKNAHVQGQVLVGRHERFDREVHVHGLAIDVVVAAEFYKSGHGFKVV